MDWGNHRPEKKKKVDWESFETVGEDGDDKFVIKPPWLARVFHFGMIFLGLAMIFAAGGAIFWFLLNGPEAPAYTRAKSAAIGWGQFGLGGVLLVAWCLKLYFKKSRWK